MFIFAEILYSSRMQDFIISVRQYLRHLYSGPMIEWDFFAWFLINMALFVPLVFFWPGNRAQPRLHRGLLTDALYWFCGPFICGPAFRLIGTFLISLGVIRFIQIHGGLAELPLLVQAALILVLTDFLQYWIHRGFHHARVWKFHAIHHSASQVDWLTSARFHPVNFIIYSTAVNALVMALGFNIEAFIILLPFNAIISPLVHANLDWSFGPFKYVVASPVFHRWHHTHPDEGGNKNFAPSLPVMDIIFGTFYMPEGKKPEKFGTPHDPITDNILQQLAYPFLPRARSQKETSSDNSTIKDVA